MTPTVPQALVGRDAELRATTAALAPGGSGLVAVTGPPGIGKTRLVAELVRAAQAGGALVLTGRGSEFEQDLPFGVWTDALDDHLRSLEDAPADALGGTATLEALTEVLPGVAARADVRPDAAPLADERHRLHAATRTLLEHLAADRPLVVVLDDLHWADEASVDLAATLLRRPPAGPVGLVLAFRPHQASVRLTAALPRAERDNGLVAVALEPLGRADSERLIGGRVGAAQLADLHERSGGNPFYLEQLVRTPRGRVPRGVTEAIAEELRAVPADARAVLQAAAVVGDPFDLDLVAVAADRPADHVAAAIDRLLAQDLVRETEVPRRFAMRHPLVRSAVYESAGGGWRTGAHARVARALADRGAPPEHQAHHVAYSAAPGDRDAIELLHTAAEHSLHRAPATAVRWLQAALVLAESAPAAGARPALLVALGHAQTAAGRLEEARATTAAALDAATDPGQRLELTASCAALEHQLGRHEDARRRLTAALADLPEDPSPTRLSLLVELAMDGFYAGDLEAMGHWGAQARDDGRRAGDDAHAFAGAVAAGLAAVLAGRTAEAREVFDAATVRYDELPDAELARRLDGAQFLALLGMYLEEPTLSARQSARAAAIARQTRQGHLLPVLAIGHGYAAFMAGRVAEGVAVLEAAVEQQRLSGTTFSLSWTLLNLVTARTWAGDLDTAIREGEEALELVRDLDPSIVGGYPGAALADALTLAGQERRAVEVLLTEVGGPQLTGLRGYWRVYGLELLVRAALGAERIDLARATAAFARTVAGEYGTRLSHVWAARAAARVALHDGDGPAALIAAREAMAHVATADAPVEAARSRMVLGRALAVAGDKTAALQELRDAVTALDAAGAGGWGDAAARELRRLGHRPARGAGGATGLASLSAREREIAELVHAGLTNPQIARELYLSPKTVESHVRNLFAKLRVSSRREVADAVARGED